MIYDTPTGLYWLIVFAAFYFIVSEMVRFWGPK